MEKKEAVTYPCAWQYKVIGMEIEELRQVIIQAVGDGEQVFHSNSSSNGKYHCLNLEITVQSQEVRDSIYCLLKKHAGVKMVL
ncbi:MAG: DUF493 domain-containing protein [Proteobacteria bacterium]|nr:DUF493 domain-containing protein [Pseudomonadota bacterium]MBU1710355.1 DUF493 domain-containing protein [Pseudomonadota bacterium]